MQPVTRIFLDILKFSVMETSALNVARWREEEVNEISGYSEVSQEHGY
jgi:hypothetical protein